MIELDGQIKIGTLSEQEAKKAKDELKTVSEELTKIIPELQIEINNETGALSTQIGTVLELTNAYIHLAQAKAMVNAYQSKIDAAATTLVELKEERKRLENIAKPELIELTADGTIKNAPKKSFFKNQFKGINDDAFEWTKAITPGTYDAIDEKIENVTNEMNRYLSEISAYQEEIDLLQQKERSQTTGAVSSGGTSSSSSSSGSSSKSKKESEARKKQAEAYKKSVEQEIEAEERKYTILKQRGQVSQQDYAANVAYRADCYRGYADAVLKQDGITTHEQEEIRREWIEKAEDLETEYLLAYINMDKEALDKQKKNGEISQKEYWSKLTALRDKYFAEGSEDWIKYSEEIIDLQKKSITEAYTELAKKAKESFDDIENAQKSLESKLKGFGNIFKQNVIRKAGDHGEDLNFVTLRDFEEENKALLAYEDALGQFRERGEEILGDDFSSFFEQFAEMSIEDGTEAVRALLSASDEELEKSLGGWREYQRNSERFAETYYKSEKDKMLSELRESFDNVNDEFFGSGELAAEAFGDGFFAEIEEIFKDIADAVSLQMAKLTPQLSIAGSAVSAGNTTYNNTTYNLRSSWEPVHKQLQMIEAAEARNRLRGK